MTEQRRGPRWLLYAVFFWVVATFAHVFANVIVERQGITGDDRQNVLLGLRLSNDGHFDMLNEPAGYHRREPFFPAVIAAANVVQALWSGSRLPVECGISEKSATPECVAGLTRLKLINCIMLVGTGLAAGWLVLLASRSYILGGIALVTTGMSMQLVLASSYFLTEVPTALLMTLSSLFAWLVVTRGRLQDVVFLSVCLACLTLTKVIFAYLWLPYVGIIGLALRGAPQSSVLSNQRLWILWLCVFTTVYFAIVGGWMARNWLVSGHFELVEQRSFKVLSVRASYNRMTWQEVKYGFVLHTPMLGQRALRDWGVPEADYSRLLQKNEEGFRRLGQKQYRKRLAELLGFENDPEIETNPEKRAKYDEVTRLIAQEALARIKADPMGHLRASIAVGYRTLFPESGWGLACHAKQPRLAQQFGLNIVCPVWKFTPIWSTVYNLGAFLALLILPLSLYLFRPASAAWLGGIAVVLPAVYSHLAYTAASHFIVRYAVPEIPIRNIAFFLMISVVFEASTNRFRTLKQSAPNRM